jgi:enoyl-CoA hydratase/carnithine racemase
VYAAGNMSGTVHVSADGGVAIVTVDNPPVNALADGVLEALGAAAGSLAADDDVRAVVLTGAGSRSFLAGADLEELERSLGDEAAMEGHVELTGRVFGALQRLEVPVVAAVGGHAVGGGLEVALICDLIVAEPRAKLGLPEVTLGLIPGAGGTQRLPRRVGASAATRMLLTGELVDAAAARELGLVDVLAAEGEALAEAVALARRFATLPARALRAAKAALRAAATQPLSDGLLAERRLFLGVAASADAREGAAAFVARRRPEFTHS